MMPTTAAWGVLVSLLVLVVTVGGADPTTATQISNSNGTVTPDSISPTPTSFSSGQTLLLSSSATSVVSPSISAPNGTNSTLVNPTASTAQVPSASETPAAETRSNLPEVVSLAYVPTASWDVPTATFTSPTSSLTVSLATASSYGFDVTATISANDTNGTASDTNSTETVGPSTSNGSDVFTPLTTAPTPDISDAVTTTLSIEPTQVSPPPTVVPTSTGTIASGSDISYQVSTASVAPGNFSGGPPGKPTTGATTHEEEKKHSSLSDGAKAAIGIFVSLAVCGIICGAIVCSRRSNMTARSVKSLITSGIRYKTYKNKDDEGMLIMPDRR